MDEHKRIYWERGLDITPEIFTEADNYHIAQQNKIARLYAFRLYGILPGSTFEIKSRINNYEIFFDEIYCKAITRNGCLVDIQNDISFEEVSLRELINGEHYVILSSNPYHPEPIKKGGRYARVKYHIEIKEARQCTGDGIPILKIRYNRDSHCWQIEQNYVLPHVCLSTSEILKQKYHLIREELNAVIEKISLDELAGFQARLLEVELKNYSLQESPAELALLLKKITSVLKLHFERTKNENEFLMASIEICSNALQP